MKRKTLLLIVSLLLLIISSLTFIYFKADSNSAQKSTVEEITYGISEEDYINAIATSEGIPYESAKIQFVTERESRSNDSHGSYSYVAVETTYPTIEHPYYRATIVGNYEIYSSENSKQITDCTVYSKSASTDSGLTWIQTTSADATVYPNTTSYISVTGKFQKQSRWKTETSETIHLTQKFDINSL